MVIYVTISSEVLINLFVHLNQICMLTKEKKSKLIAAAKKAALEFKTNPTEKNFNDMQATLATLNVGLEKIGLKTKDRIEICGKRQKIQKELNQKVQPCTKTKETVEVPQEQEV